MLETEAEIVIQSVARLDSCIRLETANKETFRPNTFRLWP